MPTKFYYQPKDLRYIGRNKRLRVVWVLETGRWKGLRHFHTPIGSWEEPCESS